MYRPGIWRRNQLLNTREQICGFRIGIAYNLLNSSGPSCSEDVKAFERTTRAIKLSSGVHRTTYRARFSDLDVVTHRIMQTVFAPNQKLRVHDWAASAGLLSVEWASHIWADFPSAVLIASDYFLFLLEAQNSAGETFILEPDGTAIQYINPPFVVSLVGKERSLFLLNRLAIAWARRSVEDLKEAAVQVEWDGIPDPRTHLRGKWRFRQINLIHPEARRLAQENQYFQMIRHDAFCKLAQPCEVLRVMNLYNPRIWGNEKATSGVKAAVDSVVDGGLLILGRTVEDKPAPKNNASIFRKRGDRVNLIERLNAGFEMERATLEL